MDGDERSHDHIEDRDRIEAAYRRGFQQGMNALADILHDHVPRHCREIAADCVNLAGEFRRDRKKHPAYTHEIVAVMTRRLKRKGLS